MKTLRTFPGQRVALGHQGENFALTVIFNIGAWADAYGPGTTHLVHMRTGDTEAYPVAVTQDGTEVSWEVSDADTAVDGYGKYELRYIVGETVVKSSVGETYVRKALQYGAEAPDPIQGWVDHMTEKEHELLEAVGEAKEASEKAAGAAGDALTFANAAAQAAGSAEEAARNAALAAQNVSDLADNARLSAKAAADQAGQAAGSAKEAKDAVEEARNIVDGADVVKSVNGQTPDENGNVRIEVGSGSGVDVTAKPGQLIRVQSVDENGKPTAWEAVPWGYTEGGMVEIPVAYEWLDNSGATITAPIGLKAGNTYTVVWDGVEYVVTAREEEMEGLPAIVLGNTTGETSEAFMLAELPAEAAIEMGFYGMAVDVTGGAYKDFSIYHNAEIPHPIPGKLLPEGVPYVEKGVPVELIPESQMTFLEEGQFALFTCPKIVEGKNYIINWNGAEYECTAILTDPKDGLCFCGNVGAMEPDKYADTGEPFVVGFMPGQMTMAIPLDGSTEVTLSVKEANVTIQKMDIRCLPDDVSRVKYYDVDFELQIINGVTTASTTKTFAEIYAKALAMDVVVRGVTRAGAGALYYSMDFVTSEKVSFYGYNSLFGNVALYGITVNADDTVDVFTKTL